MVRRRHAGEAVDIAEREPRHFRACEQLVVRDDASGLVEGADLDGNEAGPQLDLVEHAGAAGRAEVARDRAAGIALRPIGPHLAREGEPVARHGQADMKSAAARALAMAAAADEAPDRRSPPAGADGPP